MRVTVFKWIRFFGIAKEKKYEYKGSAFKKYDDGHYAYLTISVIKNFAAFFNELSRRRLWDF